MSASDLRERYGQVLDRESAYEQLVARLAPPVGDRDEVGARDEARGQERTDDGRHDEGGDDRRGSGDGRGDSRGGGDDSRGGRDDSRGGRGDSRGGRDDSRGGRDDSRDGRSAVGSVLGSAAFKSFMRGAGTVIGREITRSVLGTARRSRRR